MRRKWHQKSLSPGMQYVDIKKQRMLFEVRMGDLRWMQLMHKSEINDWINELIQHGTPIISHLLYIDDLMMMASDEPKRWWAVTRYPGQFNLKRSLIRCRISEYLDSRSWWQSVGFIDMDRWCDFYDNQWFIIQGTQSVCEGAVKIIRVEEQIVVDESRIPWLIIRDIWFAVHDRAVSAAQCYSAYHRTRCGN